MLPFIVYEEAAFQALFATDCVQTYEGVAHHGAYERLEDFAIGHYPNKRTMELAWVTVAPLHAFVSYELRGHPRLEQVWQITSIGIEGQAVVSNFSVRF